MPVPVMTTLLTANAAPPWSSILAMNGLASIMPCCISVSVKTASAQLSNMMPTARKNSHG